MRRAVLVPRAAVRKQNTRWQPGVFLGVTAGEMGLELG